MCLWADWNELRICLACCKVCTSKRLDDDSFTLLVFQESGSTDATVTRADSEGGFVKVCCGQLVAYAHVAQHNDCGCTAKT
jgi:hypothetical protein